MATDPGRVKISAGPLERTDSLREQALAVLRQAVVSGRIRTGELYSVAALARELGVSLSPVREAMMTLVNDGIMEPVRNRGFRLVALDEHDLKEIVELRTLLEVPAVGALALLDLTADVAELRARAGAIERAAERGDVPLFLHEDREFHLALLRLTGNRRLVEIVANLRDQTRLYGLYELAGEGLLTASAVEHGEILDALVAGDRDAAERLMTSHLAHITGEWSSGTR
jgi:DNA-binding GntR family transcriptional regulator